MLKEVEIIQKHEFVEDWELPNGKKRKVVELVCEDRETDGEIYICAFDALTSKLNHVKEGDLYVFSDLEQNGPDTYSFIENSSVEEC